MTNRVLVYHKVDVRSEIGITVVKPDQFRRQIEFLLSEGFQIGTLRDLYQNYPDDKRRVALTFDDGYENIYHYAYPILKELGIAATVFLVTGYLGKRNRWDANLGGIHFTHLSQQQVVELVQNGWEIGSHTVSHRCLSGMPVALIRTELRDSKQYLETTFDREVAYFSAPFGKTNRQILEIVREVGYRGVCGFFPFKYLNSPAPAEFIPRLAVYSTDSLSALKRKLGSGGGLRYEVTKQNVINFCANATIMVNSLR